MLLSQKLLLHIEAHIKEVLAQESQQGKDLWQTLLHQHPADIATLITRLESTPYQQKLFQNLPDTLAYRVFEKLPQSIQLFLLKNLSTETITTTLHKVHIDELTDLFEHLSDEELKKNLKLLQKKQRTALISHLNFAPQSAGRIMNSDVLTFEQEFTVKKCVNLLQRIGPEKELLQKIYVTDSQNVLQGFVTLDKLVLSKPDTILKTILQKVIVTIGTHEDQETVARTMHHYDLMSAPVVDQYNHFLGVITADDVFDVLEEEASEDVYKMSGMAPVERSYFRTSLWTFIWQRFWWLGALLVLQSFSGFIVSSYEKLIHQHVIVTFFITMLIGTGGNAGNQSATLVIRGLATGEIKRSYGMLLLIREFIISSIMALMLSIVSFMRVYFTHADLLSAFAISTSLFFIVITAVLLGTLVPLILERFNIDPAHSAAPFLATLTDIIGMLIYCVICSKILG